MRLRVLLVTVVALAGSVLFISCSDYGIVATTPNLSSSLSIISPSSAVAGGPSFTLTATGAGFVSTSVVEWNGVNLSTTFVSSFQLTAQVPAANISSVGTAPIMVLTPPPNGGNSNVLVFTVVPSGNPVPALSSISPASAVAGGAAFTLTLNGSNFVSSSVVQWNANNRTTAFVNSSQLTAQIPASDIAAAGTARVSVFNPAPGGGSSNTLTFTITAMLAAPAGPADVAAPALSPDGRWAAYVWQAPNAASAALDEIFLRDTCAGAPLGCAPSVTRISVAMDGGAPDGPSFSPSVSADGRFVAFVSLADNLVPGDTSGVADVFLRDTCRGAPAGCAPTTSRVSIANDFAEANAPSASPAISADGRFVVFESQATNLVAGGSAAAPRVFLRDTCFAAPEGCLPSTTRLAAPLPRPPSSSF